MFLKATRLMGRCTCDGAAAHFHAKMEDQVCLPLESTQLNSTHMVHERLTLEVDHPQGTGEGVVLVVNVCTTRDLEHATCESTRVVAGCCCCLLLVDSSGLGQHAHVLWGLASSGPNTETKQNAAVCELHAVHNINNSCVPVNQSTHPAHSR